MKTKEEIYLELWHNSPPIMNFYDYKKMAIQAMEEYGKLMYNQAIDDCVKNVELAVLEPNDNQEFIILNSTINSYSDLDNDRVYEPYYEKLLKLKK